MTGRVKGCGGIVAVEEDVVLMTFHDEGNNNRGSEEEEVNDGCSGIQVVVSMEEVSKDVGILLFSL